MAYIKYIKRYITKLYPIYNNKVKSKWACIPNINLDKSELIFPVFISYDNNEMSEIKYLPQNYRIGINKVIGYLDPLINKGLSSIILFGNISDSHKDNLGSNSSSNINPVINAVSLIKKTYPDLNIICDVCLCSYTDTGECYVKSNSDEIDYEKTINQLCEISLCYVKAGADIIAPSDMIDNRVIKIKTNLSIHNFYTPIMSYSGKFRSHFYSPFRNAVNTSYCNKSSLRINQIPHGSESLFMKCIDNDIKEGADYIIIKPGLHSLDLISKVKIKYPYYNIFPFHVSGECAMLYNASQCGILDFSSSLLELIYSFKRAGSTGVITYFVPQLLDYLS